VPLVVSLAGCDFRKKELVGNCFEPLNRAARLVRNLLNCRTDAPLEI
jgi:hypothetical protein